MVGANQVVGHVGFVRVSSASWTFSGRSTVQPSAICSAGPSPLTRFNRHIVTGIPPLVRKREDQPPPGKYSVMDGCHVTASRHFCASSLVISQNGFITGWPSRDF